MAITAPGANNIPKTGFINLIENNASLSPP
jgi:hypothetical protein